MFRKTLSLLWGKTSIDNSNQLQNVFNEEKPEILEEAVKSVKEGIEIYYYSYTFNR